MEMAMRNRDRRQVVDNGDHFDGWYMGVQLQNVRRIGDGTIDYDFYKRRMRQLRAQCLAEMLSAAWRGSVAAVKSAVAAIRLSFGETEPFSNSGAERLRLSTLSAPGKKRLGGQRHSRAWNGG